MGKRKVLYLLSLPVFFMFSSNLTGQTANVEIKGGPMHPLCKSCHQPTPNVIMGLLDTVSYKAQLLTIDVGTHKETIRFDEKTLVKNLKGLEDLKNFRNKGFTIQYEEKEGVKKAVLISRFDVLKLITEEDRLNKEKLKNLLAEGKNVYLYDSRPLPAYQEAHIPGAKPLPAPAFDQFIQNLPPDKNAIVIFYCVGGCLSPTNYLRTKALGYTNVKIYLGGFPEWIQSEYAITTPEWMKKAIEEKYAYVLIDLRPRQMVKEGYIATAVSIPYEDLPKMKDQFPTQKKAPIILYGPKKEEAAKLILSWGYKNVRILPIEFEDWKKRGFPIASGEPQTKIAYVPKAKPGTILPSEFLKIAQNPPANTLIIDVRNPDEVKEGKVKAAKNIPLEELEQRLAEIPKDKDIILYCETGIRAQMAHEILKKHGIKSRYLEGRVHFTKDGKVKVDLE